MRVAEVSAFSQYSVGKIMRDIKDYIDKNTGDVCNIFYARGEGPQDGGIHKYAKNLEIYLNAIRARLLDDDGFGFKGNTRRLIKRLKEFNPDVVHIHCLHGYYMNVELLFKYFKESGVKVIWTMHDAWAFTGHCCFFSMVGCTKWKKQCKKCIQKSEYPTSIGFDKSFRNYNKKKNVFRSLDSSQMELVTPSDWLKNLIKESYLNKFNVTTIHNTINYSVFNLSPSEEQISLPNKKILLGVASVWDKRKGLETFLDIAKVISDDWHIILIGRIDQKVKMPNNVTHISRTSNQQVLKAYYQKATVLLNPTLDDNYPTVNLEAQACGCCVVTFDTGGCCETDIGNLVVCADTDVFHIVSLLNSFQNRNGLTNNNDENMGQLYWNVFKG